MFKHESEEGVVNPRVSDFQFPVRAAEHTVPLPSRSLGCRSVEQRQILYEATRINNPVKPPLPFFEGRHLWNPESGRNQTLREAGWWGEPTTVWRLGHLRPWVFLAHSLSLRPGPLASPSRPVVWVRG